MNIWVAFSGFHESRRRALIYSQQFQQVTLGRKGLLFQLALLLKFREITHLSLFQASGKWRTVSAFFIPLNACRWLPYSGASAGYLISLILVIFPVVLGKNFPLKLLFCKRLLLLSSFWVKATDVSDVTPGDRPNLWRSWKQKWRFLKKGNTKS